MPILEMKNVKFTYPGGFEAVKGLSFSIQPGEKVAIIGENGAGKTTTAKLINGLLRPTSGTVLVGGEDTAGKTVASIASQVGYVFQNPDDQICNNTVEDEITYTMRFYKKETPEKIHQKAEEVLQLIGMEGKGEDNPYDLSYSHRKFVTIGVVIMQNTPLVVLDEPTAGQDKAGMDRIASIIESLCAQGKAVLTITHDMEFVAQHFDRAIVMAHGQIIADDQVRNIFWNLPVLKEAALSQPYISILAGEMGLPGKIITIEEFEQELSRA